MSGVSMHTPAQGVAAHTMSSAGGELEGVAAGGGGGGLGAAADGASLLAFLGKLVEVCARSS